MDYEAVINIPEGTDFGPNNIPFGAFINEHGEQHLCTRIGDTVIDLFVLDEAFFFDGPNLDGMMAFQDSTLNFFMSMGRPAWREAREWIQDAFGQISMEDVVNAELFERACYAIEDVELCMPFEIPNYTDFYSSENHARNVGMMFRGSDELMPNWKHIPIGYHGRASSIVLSGEEVKRPSGMILNGEGNPEFKVSEKVDFELEMGFVIGTENQLGQPVSADDAFDHIFGLVLVNDWSARDIQKFEYQPLGPFTAKNWATSISPWVITLEALDDFKTNSVEQDPIPADYLRRSENQTFDIEMEVQLTAGGERTSICRTNYKTLYWSMEQQLAQQTVTGCNLKTGDLLASGTISGSEPGSYGSMLELSWNGEEPMVLPNGEIRAFLEDGDEVIFNAYCERDGKRLGFGELRNKLI